MHHIYYNMHVMAYKCQYIIEFGVNWLFIFFHGAYISLFIGVVSFAWLVQQRQYPELYLLSIELSLKFISLLLL